MSYKINYYESTCYTWMGAGAVKKVGEAAKEKGLKKMLIVTDPFLGSSPIVEKVKASLDAEGVGYVVFDKCNVDPLDTVVYEAAELGKQEGIDGIIGLGGGSPMDAAKSIGILQTNPAPLSQYYGVFAPNPTVPIFESPTTTGTGSESTFYSVISDTTTNTKKVPFQKADLAICDPELTYDLPAELTAATAMDAFAHAAECMTGLIQCPKTDALCGWGIKLLMENVETAVHDPHNEKARENMMIASNLIGAGFGVMGCHLGHAIGQCMGAAFHTTHGISCAWPLPAVMEYAAVSEPEQVKLVADYMGLTYDPDITPEGIGKLVSDEIKALMKRIHIKPMTEYGITREAMVGIADIVMADNCWPVIPRPLSKAQLEEMLGDIWDYNS